MPGIIDAATDQVKEKEITTVMVVGNRFFFYHGFLRFLLKKIG